MKVQKFRKKPETIEVMGPLTSNNAAQIAKWMGAVVTSTQGGQVGVYLEGNATRRGAWVPEGDYAGRMIETGAFIVVDWSEITGAKATYEPVGGEEA